MEFKMMNKFIVQIECSSPAHTVLQAVAAENENTAKKQAMLIVGELKELHPKLVSVTPFGRRITDVMPELSKSKYG
jgi:hypothetical protein